MKKALEVHTKFQPNTYIEQYHMGTLYSLRTVTQEYFTAHDSYGQKNLSDLSHQSILELLLWEQILDTHACTITAGQMQHLLALDNNLPPKSFVVTFLRN